jgi:hypothetical protein
MGGLFVATLLALLEVPPLYALWFRCTTTKGAENQGSEPAPAMPANGEPEAFRGRLAPVGIAAE